MSVVAVYLVRNNPGPESGVLGVEEWLWDFIGYLLNFRLKPPDPSAGETYKVPVQLLPGFEELDFPVGISLGVGA